jgi:ribosomal protein S14
MKKLLEKDKKLRLTIRELENQHLILKSIFKNLNLFTLIRWNAFIKLHSLSANNNKNALSNRCLHSTNKKRFNKLTNFSRQIFLKLIRSGQISGMNKSSW